MAKAPLPLASTMNRTSVDAYLRDGCGRCAHYRTPACKVRAWTPVLEALRAIAQASGLTETMKWGSPCYTLAGKNVLMAVAFKESCALQFFKGAALVDDAGLLESPGPNSRFGRFLRFLSVAEVKARRAVASSGFARWPAKARRLRTERTRPDRPPSACRGSIEVARGSRAPTNTVPRRSGLNRTPGRHHAATVTTQIPKGPERSQQGHRLARHRGLLR